jgi:hypothetical protein
MSFLTVRLLTVYRYSEPVGLGEHRMMFRPRESHGLRLLKLRLDITPHPTSLRWLPCAQLIARWKGPGPVVYSCASLP